MTIDVNAMGLRELLRLQADVETAIAGARALERNDLLAKMMATAAAHGFKLDDLFAPKRSKRANKKTAVIDVQNIMASAPVKYVNPRKRSETWAGRGRRPLWLQRQLKRRGAKLETFAVRHA